MYFIVLNILLFLEDLPQQQHFSFLTLFGLFIILQSILTKQSCFFVQCNDQCNDTSCLWKVLFVPHPVLFWEYLARSFRMLGS